jgi:hypothetical protein
MCTISVAVLVKEAVRQVLVFWEFTPRSVVCLIQVCGGMYCRHVGRYSDTLRAGRSGIESR